MNSPFALFMHVLQSPTPPPMESYDDVLPPAHPLRALILRCFVRDPDARPTAFDLLQDPFLTSGE